MPSSSSRSMGGFEWSLLVALSVLWGGSFLFGKVAVSEIPPLSVTLGRVALAALALGRPTFRASAAGQTQRIAIVGAGIAGLTAAMTLLPSGVHVTHVQFLEASRVLQVMPESVETRI